MAAEPWLRPVDVALRLKLYKRDGQTLNVKSVYELPIRKHKLPGVGVRYRESDVQVYEDASQRRALIGGRH